MSKAPSPLLGYNNNVRHKNRVFHIQTEDSGVKHPHVITHLFMDGGRILKSVKRSYAEHVGSDGLADVVRGMMKEQHKAMFIALRDGQFDHLVDAAEGTGARPAVAPPSSGAVPSSGAGLSGGAPPSSGAASPSTSGDTAATASQATPAKKGRSSPPPAVAPKSAPQEERTAAPGTDASELTLDIAALERAAAAEQSSVPSSMPGDPPPPSLLQRKPDTGRYRNIPSRDTTPEPPPKKPLPALVPPPTPAQRTATSPGLAAGPPPPAKPVPPPPPKSKTVEKPPAPPAASGDGRYAPARPAAIFGQARPLQGSSIFGEDLISDKSLDEVILSYLAEDLEADKK